VGRDHPERPKRFDAVVQGLREAGLVDRLGRVQPRPATEEELLLCHAREYLHKARHYGQHRYGFLSTGNTDITSNSLDNHEAAIPFCEIHVVALRQEAHANAPQIPEPAELRPSTRSPRSGLRQDGERIAGIVCVSTMTMAANLTH